MIKWDGKWNEKKKCIYIFVHHQKKEERKEVYRKNSKVAWFSYGQKEESSAGSWNNNN